MLEAVRGGIVELLKNAGINAAEAFEDKPLDRSVPQVIVEIAAMKITSSGMGNYIGLCSEDGQIREMFGDSAEISLALDVYAPENASKTCLEVADAVKSALDASELVSVRRFETDRLSYDADSRMLHLPCKADCKAYLVRQWCDGAVSEYELSGEGIWRR